MTDKREKAAAAESAKGLRREAAKNEKKTERQMGKELKKGGDRFEERSRSSDGKSAEDKQDL